MPPPDGYDAERVRAVAAAWRELRAHYERYGQVDEDEWAEVLDVERALGALGSYVLRHRPHDALGMPDASEEFRRRRTFDRLATAAAATLACQMLLGWSASDVRFALPRGYESPELLERKAVAWMAAYLSGRSFEECDAAFEAET